MRAAGKDATVVISEPIPVTLDYALEYVADDELVEVRTLLLHAARIRISSGQLLLQCSAALRVLCAFRCMVAGWWCPVSAPVVSFSATNCSEVPYASQPHVPVLNSGVAPPSLCR